ncbi:RNA pyrophosphohydrolase [Pararhodospirillum oryzae]|uniref:RNA pyrophosphohydrolase n=1 Tax=Pararhodospirillum oryzae TaxID=478448 RepID=A0A512H8B1_9PROT|nr:RNA pyrophosphohydrolase [Pararhodospirillum oryzae]GEO81699.1 RNA pyrophosphohydrolase [Pararhodospirillum oryzae]
MKPSSPPADPSYRRGVGIMLINAAGLVFVAQRIDVAAEAWQMPQGGLEPGEEPLAGALRELEEEIGTARAEVLGETAGWLTYDLPQPLQGGLWRGRYRGQTQKWFALRFTGQDQDINLATEHPEFREWRWVPVETLVARIVPFKRALYEAVVAELGSYARPVA